MDIKLQVRGRGRGGLLKLEDLLVCVNGGLVTISKCGALQGTAPANIINPQQKIANP